MKSNKKILLLTNFILVSVLLSVFAVMFLPPNSKPIYGGEEISAIYRGNEKNRNVSLMFNVYENAEVVEKILKVLETYDVKATFFMINRNMNRYKEEVKKIQENGHGAGFHSVTHDKKSLYKTPQATLKEFLTCRETFEEITGETSNLIRIPYGSKPNTPEESYNILVENGFLIWDWNLDTKDWKSTTDNIVSNVLLNGRKKDELVLLVHEKEQTIKALDDIIKVLKERGYQILPITEDKEAMNFWRKNL